MKHKTINKLFAVLLTCGMAASSLTGCGNNNSATESSESKSSAVETSTSQEAQSTEASTEEAFDPRSITEGVKLTIAVDEDAKVKDFNTNQQTLLIEEALGVDLEFMVLPSADYASKLNVMVMGGEKLPDIIFDPKGWEDWIEEDVLVELSEYYDNPDYSANIRAGSERAELDIIMYMTRPDGSKYTLPGINQELYRPVQQKLWVYQPWLDALGLDVPETTEEFYEACKLVVENDMNGNGKKDEIGVTGTSLNQWFDCMMSAFVYAHEVDWRVVEDGQISFAFDTDEWKEGLKYIRKFFEEGLIPVETLTQSGDQYKSVYYSETPVVFSFADWCYSGSDTTRRREYTVVPALEGPEGVQWACNYPFVPSAGAVITTDCENPLAAFLVCDYMCSMDVSLTSRFGEQGVDWDYWDVAQTKFDDPSEFVPTFEGYDIAFYPYDMINFWNSTDPQEKCYRQAGPKIIDKTLTAGAGVWIGSDDEVIRTNAELEVITAAAAMKCYDYIPEEVFDYAPFTSEETDQTSDIKSTMKSYVKEMTSAFLSGEKDIDAEWDNYLNELDKIGYKEYLEVLQTAYDRIH